MNSSPGDGDGRSRAAARRAGPGRLAYATGAAARRTRRYARIQAGWSGQARPVTGFRST
ncbi:hypothetical protein ABZ860_31265 [Microbispora sp. NPDC046973]|uniref:hypothetical protein n=1 Tax=Microbispora sp. NPDC046973 TaxID=3155022 RepID=UPI0033DB856E